MPRVATQPSPLSVAVRRWGLALGLGGCGDEERFAPQLPSREEWLDRGPLTPRLIEVNGVSLHALEATEAAPADATPLVLIHGSGLSGRYMIPTARELAPHFPVYVPDLPGYGDSGDPGRVLNIPQLADWLVAWMDAIGLERASFLGNSFGCQVIVDLAMRYPERTERLVLQGPTTPPTSARPSGNSFAGGRTNPTTPRCWVR